MFLSNFFYPNKDDGEKFTIERRYGDKLVLYYYDPVAQVSRPLVVLESVKKVEIPFLNLTASGTIIRHSDHDQYVYPHFDFLNEFEVKTTLINREYTFTEHELHEIYLFSIAKNFHKFKHFFESKWKT